MEPVSGWALTQAISPRPTVRLADLGPDGRPVNSYSRQGRLSGAVPRRPYAVYLTDTSGSYRLLGFDLDPHAGPVGEDLAELLSLLQQAGITRPVVCASGPGGGRHVWVALAQPAPAALVDALARSLAARLPSVDIAPLVNPATGCLRPPGAPHRLGGRSELLSGSAPDLLTPQTRLPHLHALLSLLGPPPARRPAPAARTVLRDPNGSPYLLGARTALPAGSRTALDSPLPAGADASAVLWTVLVGAARACWRLTDLTRLLPTAPGMEHARSARAGASRTPRRATASLRLLTRQWGRAVTYAATTPLAAGDDPTFDSRAEAVVTAVATAQARATASPGRWARAGGPSDRRVLDAVCDQLLAAVRPKVELDVRRLAGLCGISRETARRALHRLTADGWLVPAQPAAGVHAAYWGLVVPLPEMSTRRIGTGVSQAVPRPPGAGAARDAWRSVLRRRLATTAHDVFTPSPGLGHHVARVYAQLAWFPQTLLDLGAALGYSRGALVRYLDRVAAAGLARSCMDKGWTRGPTDPDRLAVSLGTAGLLRLRQRRYALERQAWEWWLEELEWMHFSRRVTRRTTPPADGQGVLQLSGLSTRHRHGAHPRKPNGRADFAAALAMLIATAAAAEAVAA